MSEDTKVKIEKEVKIIIGGKDVISAPNGTMKAGEEYLVLANVANFFIKRKEAKKA